jgi:small subunit ribosomal protein S17
MPEDNPTSPVESETPVEGEVAATVPTAPTTGESAVTDTAEAASVSGQETTPAKAAAPAKSAPPAKSAAPAKSAPGAKRPDQPARTAKTADDAGRTSRRKVREGLVVSNGMEKTAVVVIIERVRHPRYAKTVQRTKRLYAHDETNDVRVGDRVRLVETRPLSKLKRWRVERVLERAR